MLLLLSVFLLNKGGLLLAVLRSHLGALEAVAEGLDLLAEGVGDPQGLLARALLGHRGEVEAGREEPKVGEDAVNNHPEELAALDLDHLADLLSEADGLLASGLEGQILLAAGLDRGMEARPSPRKIVTLLGELSVLEGKLRLQALQGLPHDAEGNLAVPLAPVPAAKDQVAACGGACPCAEPGELGLWACLGARPRSVPSWPRRPRRPGASSPATRSLRRGVAEMEELPLQMRPRLAGPGLSRPLAAREAWSREVE